MAAIVVKSHSTDTAARAQTAREITGFPVFGGVALNYPVGGLNEYAVLETAPPVTCIPASPFWSPPRPPGEGSGG